MKTNTRIKRFFAVIVLLVGFMVTWSGAIFAQTHIQGVRLSQTSDKSTFVFDLDGQFSYKTMFLSSPDRIVIDFNHVSSAASFSNVNVSNSPVKKIRSGKHADKYQRIVFDLNKKMPYKIFALDPNGKRGHRLVIEFSYRFSQAKSGTKIKSFKPQATISAKQSLKTNRDIIVVIDPGHGGKDPGATGAKGTREKDVVLAISKKLQAEINKQPGFKAVLTRNGDYYVGLRQRMNIAHKHKADMFVAIHADAFKHAHASGASVFALSEHGATSEAARWLAKKENESELVGGVDLSDKDKLLRSVLIDLSQTYSIGVSLQMGTTILDNMGKFTELHHSKVEQAAFVVLKSPDIPSLLVETGFLSNPGEEAKLKTPKYQGRIAVALMKGIKSYFVSHPPRGTTLALKRDSKQHGV